MSNATPPNDPLQPIRVSVTVPTSPRRGCDFIDVLANHERFTNHMLVDLSYMVQQHAEEQRLTEVLQCGASLCASAAMSPVEASPLRPGREPGVQDPTERIKEKTIIRFVREDSGRRAPPSPST